MAKTKSMLDFEKDIINLLKKYGIESKQIIEHIEITVDKDTIPRVEINSMIVEELENGR